MSYEFITLEKKDRIATITINRPKMNPLSRKTYEEIEQAAKEANSDQQVKVVILTAAGDKAFASGLDLKDVAGRSKEEMTEIWSASNKASTAVAAIEKPVIAAINGMALGGGLELALCCDIRIAVEKARFSQPELGLGIIPGGGATQRLTRLIGTSKAKELFFTGEMFNARTALELGIINKIVPDDKLIEEATALAASIAGKSAVALRMTKLSVDKGLDMDLKSGLEYEGECFMNSYLSEDGREGISAFIENRKPEFKDR
ncbi:MAG: enoyl-CoA hydratase/isomerase family protein [Spirochaetes bacterium]|nr:enoyl-CoA hydratase/isomerase family protein [Spirochaetota bacterium]